MENRHCPIFNGLYEITEDGRLYSTRSGKYLSPNLDRYGYFYYVISIDSVRYTLKAHGLVAQSFIPNPKNKPTVNHKNGIRNDNRVENLEWATYEEQQADPLTTINRNEVVVKTDYAAMGALRNYGRRKTAVFDGNGLLGIYSSLKRLWKNTLRIMVKHQSVHLVSEKVQEVLDFVTFRKFILWQWWF